MHGARTLSPGANKNGVFQESITTLDVFSSLGFCCIQFRLKDDVCILDTIVFHCLKRLYSVIDTFLNLVGTVECWRGCWLRLISSPDCLEITDIPFAGEGFDCLLVVSPLCDFC